MVSRGEEQGDAVRADVHDYKHEGEVQCGLNAVQDTSRDVVGSDERRSVARETRTTDTP